MGTCWASCLSLSAVGAELVSETLVDWLAVEVSGLGRVNFSVVF